MGNKNSSIKKNLANSNPYNYNKKDNKNAQVGTVVSKDLTSDQYEYLTNMSKLNKDFIKKMFTVFVNDYPNEKIDKNEFKEFYSKFRPVPDPLLQNICDFVFNSFDTDKSGVLEFPEFLIGFCLTCQGNLKEKLQFAFSFYDIDRNGYLNVDEIKEVIKEVLKLTATNQQLDNEEVANNCIKQLDMNKDGLINKDEFLNGLLKDHTLRELMSPFN